MRLGTYQAIHSLPPTNIPHTILKPIVLWHTPVSIHQVCNPMDNRFTKHAFICMLCSCTYNYSVFVTGCIWTSFNKTNTPSFTYFNNNLNFFCLNCYNRKYPWFLCFVERASLYNLVNKTNLVHNFFDMFISILYIFRATMCP